MIAEQVSWDFDLDKPEPLYYQHGDKATHCRDCHRPIAGRWTHSSGGANRHGHFAICDGCCDAAGRAAREAKPYLQCGVHKTPYDDEAHATDCLHLTCPFCGLSEPTGYQLVQEHNCIFWGEMGYGMCLAQRYAWERVSSCIACRSSTWGKIDEPCRNGACSRNAVAA